MKHICISCGPLSGYFGDIRSWFLKVETEPPDPLGWPPISSPYPFYILDHLYTSSYEGVTRMPDNSLQTTLPEILKIYDRAVAQNQKLQVLIDRAEELENTISKDVSVANPIDFQYWLGVVRTNKSYLDNYNEYFDAVKLRMYQLTGTSSGISGITRASFTPASFLFSESVARQQYEEEYYECSDEVVLSRYEVNYICRWQYQAKHFQAPIVTTLTPEVQPREKIEESHKQYWNEMRKYKVLVDRNAVDNLHLKIAIGTARNVDLCYTWVREPVLLFNREKFKALYPALYEACRVKKDPKWKCEILPFRG